MEWYESFKEHISYRLSNPFTPAFLLSWCVLNFKTILTVLSTVPLDEKLRFLDLTYSHESVLDSGYMQGLVWPAVLALAFVIISPWFTGAIGLYWKWQKNKIKAWSVSLDESTPRSASEFVELRQKYNEHLKDKDDDIDRLNAKNESLVVSMKRLDSAIESLEARDLKTSETQHESLRKITELNAEKNALATQLKKQSEEAKSHLLAVAELQREVQDLEFQLSQASAHDNNNWDVHKQLENDPTLSAAHLDAALNGLLKLPKKSGDE